MGQQLGLCAFEGDSSKDVGGWLPIAVMMARTGLGWRMEKDAFVEVGKLGFICSLVMASGLNG
jgi:hypothetical protein